MSDIERGEQPGRDNAESAAGTDRQQSAPGGDISSRDASAPIEEVEEDSPSGGMEGEGDPGA